MRSTDQSSYIFENNLSISTLRFSAFFNSANCFFLFAARSLSPALRGVATAAPHQAALVLTNVEFSLKRNDTKHHNGYSAWSIVLYPDRFYCNDSSHKESYFAYSFHRQVTIRSLHILLILKKFILYHFSAFFVCWQSVPEPD